jgi:hypothetical protein
MRSSHCARGRDSAGAAYFLSPLATAPVAQSSEIRAATEQPPYKRPMRMCSLTLAEMTEARYRQPYRQSASRNRSGSTAILIPARSCCSSITERESRPPQPRARGLEHGLVSVENAFIPADPDCELAGCGTSWAAAHRRVQHMRTLEGEGSIAQSRGGLAGHGAHRSWDVFRPGDRHRLRKPCRNRGSWLG